MKLPPLEWDGRYNAVLLQFDDQRKVSAYIVEVRDKGAAGAREQTLELLKKKWGDPKVKKTYKEKLIFRASKPAIVVERNAPDDGWEINVGSRLDEVL